jgi:hypothetical protein
MVFRPVGLESVARNLEGNDKRIDVVSAVPAFDSPATALLQSLANSGDEAIMPPRKGTPMEIKAIRGVKDILPGEVEKWQFVERVAREVFERYGYAEIKVPIFEHTSLFSRSIGETTDIVEKEMYSFEDQGGEQLTLRPEATAGISRAYVEHKLHQQPGFVKFYCTPGRPVSPVLSNRCGSHR